MISSSLEKCIKRLNMYRLLVPLSVVLALWTSPSSATQSEVRNVTTKPDVKATQIISLVLIYFIICSSLFD